MSYGCYISFKKMEPGEMFSFLRQLKHHISEHLTEIAQENRGYCPYIRQQELDDISVSMTREQWDALSDDEKKYLFPRDFINVDHKKIQEARDWAMNSVFKYSVFYDAERGLLGAFGIPDAAHVLFDGTVYFQNSCDQNYSLEEWSGIQAFVDIYNKWQSKSDSEMLAHWVVENNPHLLPGQKPRTLYDEYSYDLEGLSPAEAEKFWSDRLDYMRKSYAYKEIWDNYENELYSSSDRLYLSVYGRDDYHQLLAFIKDCHDAHIAYCDANQCKDFETLCGMHPKAMEMWQHWFRNSEFNYLEQMQGVIARCPDFLQRNPQYQEMYDAFIAQHSSDEPAELDEPDHNDEK